MAEENGTSIDRLDIEIAANANTADTALKKLSKYLQGVTAALKGMTNGLNEQAKEAEQSADGTEKTAESVKQLSKNAKNATGFMGKFVKSIGRIAFYRAIRTVIKTLSTAIKDGLTNLKAYSDTVGTAFSPAVDNLRQHILLLKNSFATALRPVIEAIIPVIIQLVDWLSRAADFVAQVLSVITGKVDDNGRYTKAVLGDLEQSNKEAKELRHTLLGFDEINRLDGDPGKGTSAAASTQFVQAEVSPEATKWAKLFKSIDWGKVATAAGILAGIFALVKGGGIVQKFGELAAHIGSFAASHPVLLAIVAALTAMALWGDKISAWLDKAKTKVDTFFDGLKTKFNSLNAVVDMLKATFDFVIDTVGTVASMVYKLVHGDIAGALKDLVHILANIVVFIIDIVTGVINFILGCVDDTYVFIAKIVQWIWNEVLQPVFNFIAVGVKNIGIWIHNAWIDIKTGIVVAAKWVLEQINKLLLTPLQDRINAVIDWWNETFGTNKAKVNLEIDTSGLDRTIEELKETKLPSVSTDVELVPKWEKEIEPLGLKIDPEPAKQWIRDIEKSLGTTIDKVTGKFSGQIAAIATDAMRGITNSARPNKTVTQLYASGGFPSAGSLFVAGEAGPELVANIGGSTGVWNSDQLVQGMYSAFSAALAANPSGGDIYLDGEVIYKNTVRRNNNAVRATGRSALLT